MNVLDESEQDFWRKRKRLLGHTIGISGWLIKTSFTKEEETGVGTIQEWVYFNLGNCRADEDQQRGEKMYQRALQGKEKAVVPEYSILKELNNLGLLYTGLGKLDEAGKIYQRAL